MDLTATEFRQLLEDVGSEIYNEIVRQFGKKPRVIDHGGLRIEFVVPVRAVRPWTSVVIGARVVVERLLKSNRPKPPRSKRWGHRGDPLFQSSSISLHWTIMSRLSQDEYGEIYSANDFAWAISNLKEELKRFKP